MQDSLLGQVGKTPLVRLRRLAEGLPASVWGEGRVAQSRREYQGPGRDRDDRRGRASRLARRGGTIIEATAGNTGVGLAMAAAIKGYRCIFVLPDKMSDEKIRLLAAYGAEIVITPTAVAPDSAESYNGVADRLAREIPGAWRPQPVRQPGQPRGPLPDHRPEIWEQTGGRITAFVAGVGTGGPSRGWGATSRRKTRRSRSSGPTPKARSSRATRRGRGRSRGSARTSCPRPSTAR